jgi:hypothetical protein
MRLGEALVGTARRREETGQLLLRKRTLEPARDFPVAIASRKPACASSAS